MSDVFTFLTEVICPLCQETMLWVGKDYCYDRLACCNKSCERYRIEYKMPTITLERVDHADDSPVEDTP